jgi:Zn-dependent protease with chaperone function
VSTSVRLVMVFFMAGYVAPFALGRARWPSRSPRLGVATWLVLATTSALTALFAVGTLAVPVAVVGHGLADWWNACLHEWRHYYGATSPIAVGLAAALTVIMLVKLVHSVIRYRREVVGVRRLQHAGLSLLSVAGPSNVVVIPHPVPAAYCVPGRPGRVVMTDSAIEALGPDQVAAVVAHERAHLSGRHSVPVGMAAVLQGAFGRLAPVFRRASRETAALVEMVADDAAVAMCPGPRVAEALVTLAHGPATRTALGASGSDTVRRIRRLTMPQRPLGRVSTLVTVLTLCLGLVLPIVTVAGPITAKVIASTCAHPNRG